MTIELLKDKLVGSIWRTKGTVLSLDDGIARRLIDGKVAVKTTKPETATLKPQATETRKAK